MRRVGRAVLLVLLAGVGGLVGVVGSFVHDASVELVGVGVPVGLVVALGMVGAVQLLAGWSLRSRFAVLAPGAGWLLLVLRLGIPRPEGDLVVAAGVAGYVFLLGGSVLIGLGIALPYGSRPVPRPVR